jgi:pteridine reductase
MSSDRTALVTGAGARIGAAIARGLHRRGCRLIVHCNANTDGAAKVADELNGAREGSAVVMAADLSSMDGIESLAEQTKAALKSWGSGLDLLVNNASRFYPTPVLQTHVYEWDDLLDSNLRGPYFLVQKLLEPLQQAAGSVVNIIDIFGDRPMRGHTVYSVSKAGLKMLTLALASELAPRVRVNGVAPGAILWPEREMPEASRDAVLGSISLGRLGDPDDVASAVAYLALDAPYVTGEILKVDGGRSLNL